MFIVHVTIYSMSNIQGTSIIRSLSRSDPAFRDASTIEREIARRQKELSALKTAQEAQSSKYHADIDKMQHELENLNKERAKIPVPTVPHDVMDFGSTPNDYSYFTRFIAAVSPVSGLSPARRVYTLLMLVVVMVTRVLIAIPSILGLFSIGKPSKATKLAKFAATHLPAFLPVPGMSLHILFVAHMSSCMHNVL